MLKKETKDLLKKTYGIDPDKLEAAIKDEKEVDFELSGEVTLLSNTDLATRDANNKAEGAKEKEKDFENKGKELAAKAIRKKFSIDDAVGNDIDKVAEAINEKLNKGDKALQEQVAALLADKQALNAELENQRKTTAAATLRSRAIEAFPAGRKSDMKDAERLVLIEMEHEFAEHEGKVVLKKKGGDFIKDPNTHAVLGADVALANIFKERKWVDDGGGGGGRGGSDDTPGGGGAGGLKTLSAFEKKWKESNPDKGIMSAEFDAALEKHVKEVPDFNYYE
ncbi:MULTISPECIES: hypothetical protein [unclassified Paraflavitalea]|uniref:hypothetical protein n=1 Tax=unclassified Paraflavitalea TaxID=2798305 RepID=UPI003D32A6B1